MKLNAIMLWGYRILLVYLVGLLLMYTFTEILPLALEQFRGLYLWVANKCEGAPESVLQALLNEEGLLRLRTSGVFAYLIYSFSIMQVLSLHYSCKRDKFSLILFLICLFTVTIFALCLAFHFFKVYPS